ncbi:Dienelactone hydrolase OS=Streptomyces albaduncus OX=68172 GN=FHS32_003432 PE=4 SV=1 [Streptomyces griseoloalbus]
MAEVVLFHHVRADPGVVAFADELRAAGHTVHTPDLFDGRTFDSLDEGAEFAGQVAMAARGVRAADPLPRDVVYAGFSLGALPAQKLAQTQPGRGARC